MTEVRQKYNQYLQTERLSKTAEEKLSDYLVLISEAYAFDRKKLMTEFSDPLIPDALQNADSYYLYGVFAALAERMRTHKMQDTANFSALIYNEFYEKKDNIKFDHRAAWTYKIFPAQETLTEKNKKNIVRYALNVKPGIGLFKKLDNLCLKYDAFNYKVINPQIYDQRTDPIIIYANKANQEEMLKELLTLARPYQRLDDYTMLGYQKLENGVFMADEVKKEQMTQLKYDVFTKEEQDVFLHPLADEDEQDHREYNLIKKICRNEKEHPVKAVFLSWVRSHEHDAFVSNAEYQAAKAIVQAYNQTQKNVSINANTAQLDYA